MKNISSRRDYKRYILLSRPRTGSTMLNSMLRSHPNVHADVELFGRLNGRDINVILDDVFTRYPSDIQAVGFKIHYKHPTDDKSGDIWKKLVAMNDLYVIHLKRRNILRSMVSGRIANKLRCSNIRDPQERPDLDERRISLNKDEVLKEFMATRNHEHRFSKMFAHKQTIEIFYEDIITKPNNEYHRILELLNLPFSTPKARTRAMNPEKLSELIVNYTELKGIFENTKWAAFFEE